MLRMGPSRYQARVLRVLEAISHPRLSKQARFSGPCQGHAGSGAEPQKKKAARLPPNEKAPDINDVRGFKFGGNLLSHLV